MKIPRDSDVLSIDLSTERTDVGLGVEGFYMKILEIGDACTIKYKTLGGQIKTLGAYDELNTPDNSILLHDLWIRFSDIVITNASGSGNLRILVGK